MSPLIVITGPTASGKSGLAMELALKHNGEIICADSRTIYKGMDIGTAKPSLADQQLIPHHLLDVVNPDERFTAADFQRLARQAIANMRERGKVPIVVGGTGLYIDALVLEFNWPQYKETDDLEQYSNGELLMMIKKQHLLTPVNKQNRRHLINTLKRQGEELRRLSQPDKNTYVVAIATEKDILEQRIRARAREMFDAGIIAEAHILAAKYGWDSEAMTGNIYPIIKQVIDGELTLEQAEERFVIRDRQLAKRQMTWLKRHDYVQWLSLDEARDYVETILA